MRDKVIALAREAGMITWVKPPTDVVEKFERFYQLARADMKEQEATIVAAPTGANATIRALEDHSPCWCNPNLDYKEHCVVGLTEDEWFYFWKTNDAVPKDMPYPDFLKLARSIFNSIKLKNSL